MEWVWGGGGGGDCWNGCGMEGREEAFGMNFMYVETVGMDYLHVETVGRGKVCCGARGVV